MANTTAAHTFKLIKYPNLAAKIIRAYDEGLPLTPAFFDQRDCYEALIPFASPRLEHALHYYGLMKKDKSAKAESAKSNFLMHQHKKDEEALELEEFHERLNLMLEQEGQRVELLITPEQLAHLMPSFDYLIKQHGNQFLTGAPFLHGGVPHIDFFQWGNLFGVIKYLELDDEKVLKANVLIYFEDVADRTLEECITDYRQHELQLINNVLPSPIISTPQVLPQFMLKLQPRT